MFEWWFSLSRTAHAIAIGAASLVPAIAITWPYAEPYMYAHRGYVRDQLELNRQEMDKDLTKLRREMVPISLGLYDTQIGIARARRSAINNSIITLEIEAPKSDTPQELIARRQQIETLKDERNDIEAEIKKLQTLRDKN